MKLKITAALLLLTMQAQAQLAPGPKDCDEMTTYNFAIGMCEGKAMAGMPMTMIMLHGNGFLTGDIEEGPRGRNKLASPNMAMIDIGTNLGDVNYVNVDLMLTAEKWTFPRDGYPLLMQVGEENQDHQPFIDSQHPHSSPIMGLTFSDTITLNETNHFKIFLSPRGQSTDGPTAFMHRPSAQVNPDAPLGHHIGQDVGHITGSVIGAELRLNKTTFEVSTFKGLEPEPTEVDLPAYTPDSYAARITYQLTEEIHAMASAAYIHQPEAHDPDLDHIWRYSFSMYTNAKFKDCVFHDAFIYGLTNMYDHAGALQSFLYEAALTHEKNTLWGRFEAVDRTPDELMIKQSNDRSTGRAVELVTLGFTRALVQHKDYQFKVGMSATKDFLPIDYQRDYGGNPLTAKIFAQVSGMKMNQ